MKVKIMPQRLNGTICAVASKSYAHRALICAALAEGTSQIHLSDRAKDIEATIRCLEALGSKITRENDTYFVTPIDRENRSAVVLDCGESGTTLRFLVPIVAALGREAQFVGQGKLLSRPMGELEHVLLLHGAEYKDGYLKGKLESGTFVMNGDISSQFISGMLLALPLLAKESTIVLKTPPVSRSYLAITRDVMEKFGIQTDGMDRLTAAGKYKACEYTIEGDWSNGAFFLAADCTVTGLNSKSLQGDKEIVTLLEKLNSEDNVIISAEHIIDLVPILAIAAAIKRKKCRITHAERLIYKESDRLQSVWALLQGLGVKAEKTEDGLLIMPSEIKGGTINSYHDHRIAMAAAIGATFAQGEVWIEDAAAVDKSYVRFWQDFVALGGKLEVYDE